MQKSKKRLSDIDNSSNKDIDFVKEIMSSKWKFLRNVSDVEFVFKCYSKSMNPKNLVLFHCYSKHTDEELEDFYYDYKIRDYDDMEIKHVVEVSCLRKKYWVEMYKKSDADSDIPYDCIFHAEMLLYIKDDTNE